MVRVKKEIKKQFRFDERQLLRLELTLDMVNKRNREIGLPEFNMTDLVHFSIGQVYRQLGGKEEGFEKLFEERKKSK